jgi:MYXO-CTERM domain-containing protein
MYSIMHIQPATDAPLSTSDDGPSGSVWVIGAAIVIGALVLASGRRRRADAYYV